MLLAKRLGILVVSFVIGLVLTELAVQFIADTNRFEYGFIYYFFTALCLGSGIGVWIDKFAGTELLPH